MKHTPDTKKLIYFLAIYPAEEGGFWTRFVDFPAADQGESVEDAILQSSAFLLRRNREKAPAGPNSHRELPRKTRPRRRRTPLHRPRHRLPARKNAADQHHRKGKSLRKNRRLRKAPSSHPFRPDDLLHPRTHPGKPVKKRAAGIFSYPAARHCLCSVSVSPQSAALLHQHLVLRHDLVMIQRHLVRKRRT